MDTESPRSVTRWPLLRVQAGHPTSVVLLAGRFVRLATHYFRQTELCVEGELCEACDLLPARSYWYLPALHLPMRRPTLLELSGRCSSDLEQRCKLEFGRISAGIVISLSRKSPKAPVMTDVCGQQSVIDRLPFHQWFTPLMAIYRLPVMGEGEELDDYRERVRSQIIMRSKLLAAKVRTAAEKGPSGRR